MYFWLLPAMCIMSVPAIVSLIDILPNWKYLENIRCTCYLRKKSENVNAEITNVEIENYQWGYGFIVYVGLCQRF